MKPHVTGDTISTLRSVSLRNRCTETAQGRQFSNWIKSAHLQVKQTDPESMTCLLNHFQQCLSILVCSQTPNVEANIYANPVIIINITYHTEKKVSLP